MTDYQVTLLGTPGVLKHGEVVHFPYRKAEGIFYYLCVEKTTSRDELVSVFWGSSDEESGRKNLRQALFQIRRCLGEDVIVLQGRNDLKLNQRCGIRMDWDSADAEQFLCRERFLDFFYLKDCPEFDAWVEKKRSFQIERNLQYIETQLKNPAIYREVPRLQQMIAAWQYWKPWDEEMVLTGMKCYVQAEQYDLGIQLYHEYAKRLQRDLDEEPSHAVELLFRTLQHRKGVSLMRKPSQTSSFFGRLKELQYIDERIFWFLNDEATVSVVVEGEVGVGKTALMQQIYEMNQVPDVLGLVSHCYSAETRFPLKSWRDLFVQLGELQGRGEIHLSEESARMIPQMLSGMVGGELNEQGEMQSYTTLENGVLSLFKELVGKRKVILYFDSLQWMDPLSQRLLQRVMIEFGNDQIFLIATCRTDEEKKIRGLLLALRERNIITVLSLSAFTQAETEEILREALQDRGSMDISAPELFARTGGNPLVLMETLNAIRQGEWKDNCSLPRIDMLIQLRLDRLSDQERRVLDALSVHLEHADLEDLKLMVGLEPMELIEVLERLIAAGFVTEQPWGSRVIYRFKHPFYKDYVYQNLSLGKKRFWHRVIAESYDKLEAGERRQVLLPYAIRHYECCGDLGRAEALRALQTTS